MKLFNRIGSVFSKKRIYVEFIFDESYSISTEKMLLLIKRVSSSECWRKAFCKSVDPLVAAIKMNRTQEPKWMMIVCMLVIVIMMLNR